MADPTVDSINKTGQVPEQLVTLAGLGMAYAGRDYAKEKDKIAAMKPEDQLKEMERIAHQSIRETPLTKNAKPYDPQHPTVLDLQIDSYVKRSLALDAADRAAGKNSPDGTNLKGFLEGTSDAVKDVDFNRIDKLDMDHLTGDDTKFLSSMMYAKDPKTGKTKFEEVQGKINDAAAEHIDHNLKGVKFQDDLVHTIRQDQAQGGAHEFDNAKTDETKPPTLGFLQILMMFIGALLGIPLDGLLGGGQGQGQGADQGAQTEQKINDAAQKNGISVDMEKQLKPITDAATELKTGVTVGPDGKSVALTDAQRDADVKKIEDFAGIKEERKLTPDQAQQLGTKVLNDVDNLRQNTGNVSLDDLGKDIDTMTKNADQTNKLHAAVDVGTQVAATTAAGMFLGPAGFAMAPALTAGAKSLIAEWTGNNVTHDQATAYAQGMDKKKDNGPDYSKAGGTGEQLTSATHGNAKGIDPNAKGVQTP